MALPDGLEVAPMRSVWRTSSLHDEHLVVAMRSMRASVAGFEGEPWKEQVREACAPGKEGLEAAVRSLQLGLAALAREVEEERQASASLQHRLSELENRFPAAPGGGSPLQAEVVCTPRPDHFSDGKSLFEQTAGYPGSRSILWKSVRSGRSYQTGPPRPGDLLEYGLEDTVWDAAVIIGLPELSIGTSVVLLVSVLANAAVQLYFCYVLLTSESFVRAHAFRSLQPYMKSWRLSIAHDFHQMDSTGRSLGSRVCGDDQSLSVADAQASLLGEINAYLGLHPSDLVMEHFGTGPLLCSVCVFLYVVLVMREVRTATTGLLALCAIPRGYATRLEGGCVVSIATVRSACILALNLMRLFVALAILYAGILWLSSTSSTSDLVLNAAALHFILDLDEHLFHTMVPAAAQAFVRGLEPLRYKRLRWNLEAIVPLFLTAVLVATSALVLVIPNSNDMLTVKQTLCKGNLDFIVDRNPAGFVVATNSTPFVQDNWNFDALQVHAVDELIHSTGNTALQYSRFTITREFQHMARQNLKDMAKAGYCADMDTFHGGNMVDDMPSWFLAIRESTRLHQGMSLSEIPFACADYAGYCQESGLLRVACPVTCGCANPRSGLFLTGTMHGCPESCQELVSEVLESEPCEDHNTTGSAEWREYWKQYALHMGALFPRQADLFRDFAARKTAAGCSDNATDPVAGQGFCDSDAPLMEGQGLGTILGFCPNRCCNDSPESIDDCPRSCRRPPPGGPGPGGPQGDGPPPPPPPAREGPDT